MDAEYLAGQKVRYKTVYPKMEVVDGTPPARLSTTSTIWPSTRPSATPSEAPVYLLFDPFRVGASEGAGKLQGAKLPIDIVEAVVHVGADGSPHASFRPAKYAIETEEVEAHRDGHACQGFGGRGHDDRTVRVAPSELRIRDGDAQRAKIEAIVEYLRAADSGDPSPG